MAGRKRGRPKKASTANPERKPKKTQTALDLLHAQTVSQAASPSPQGEQPRLPASPSADGPSWPPPRGPSAVLLRCIVRPSWRLPVLALPRRGVRLSGHPHCLSPAPGTAHQLGAVEGQRLLAVSCAVWVGT